MALLSLDHARLRFGGIVALDDVSLEVEDRSIVGLIGPNGAGKTTAFNAITRLYRLDSGDVVFDGRSLQRTRPSRVVQLGHRPHVPEPRAVPEHDRARERARRRAPGVPLRSARPSSAARARDARHVGIAEHAERPAAGLPYGTLKRVELARALASQPRLLLLDEPAGGLNHEEVDELVGLDPPAARRARADRSCSSSTTCGS